MKKTNQITDRIDLNTHSLTGHFLVAAPDIDDPRFDKSVIYIYEHSKEKGATGLVINHPTDKSFADEVLTQLHISSDENCPAFSPDILLGGPTDVFRGFILHSNDYAARMTQHIKDNVCLTVSQDILRDLAHGKGPKDALIILGNASWKKGQLEAELKENVWLVSPFHESLLFHEPYHQRWQNALNTIRINPLFLSRQGGES